MAWSAEERQVFLRRLLPALAICVAYFTFAKGFLEDNTRRAEEAWRKLADKGISREALAGLERKIASLDQQLAETQAKRARAEELLLQAFNRRAPVDLNASLERVHQVLSQNDLALLAEAEAPSAFAETGAAEASLMTLLDSEGTRDKIPRRAWQFTLLGRYGDVFRALRTLVEEAQIVLVLALAMREPEDDSDPRMLWTLTVWI